MLKEMYTFVVDRSTEPPTVSIIGPAYVNSNRTLYLDLTIVNAMDTFADTLVAGDKIKQWVDQVEGITNNDD